MRKKTSSNLTWLGKLRKRIKVSAQNKPPKQCTEVRDNYQCYFVRYTNTITGVQLGQQHISGDILTTLFRISARSNAPNHNVVVDCVLGLVAWVSLQLAHMPNVHVVYTTLDWYSYLALDG